MDHDEAVQAIANRACEHIAELGRRERFTIWWAAYIVGLALAVAIMLIAVG